MILSDREILAAMARGEIVIDPFDEARLGGNSYDVLLSNVMKVHETAATRNAALSWSALSWSWRIRSELGDGISRLIDDGVPDGPDGQNLDMAVEPKTVDVLIPDTGIVLIPGILYLASTVEYTETHRHVPYLDGRSSVGRLGVSIHVTAGRGDVGFCNHWTMEILVVNPIRIYPRVAIGQLTYHTVLGEVSRGYATKPGTTYGAMARDPMPQPSRLWRKLTTENK